MELKTQKWLRLLTPGILLYGLLVVFCWTTKWCELAIPTTFEEVSKLFATIVLGLIYSVSGLRELSNAPYHRNVNANIKARLIEPFKLENPEFSQLAWTEIRHVFYRLVDSDETLKVKSQIIHWNGLIWTSIADFRICCVIAIIAFGGAVICGQMNEGWSFDFALARYAIAGLFFLFLLSFWFSSISTKKHQKLGEEQCDYILIHHKEKLKKYLTSALTLS